jgi:hypothetical protein
MTIISKFLNKIITIKIKKILIMTLNILKKKFNIPISKILLLICQILIKINILILVTIFLKDNYTDDIIKL